MEIVEVVRRWQAGASGRGIARSLGLARNTVSGYLAAASGLGLTRDGPPPTEDQMATLLQENRPGPRVAAGPSVVTLARWTKEIRGWLEQDRLQLSRVLELLRQQGCTVSYSSLRRFVVKEGLRAGDRTTIRMPETKPGEVAEIDFGRLGLVLDPAQGRRRLAWALVVVLAYSRHTFVWPLFQQRLADVIEGLEAAWAFFGGVPQYLVLDNFPAAVAGPDPLHPRLTRGFLEYAQHRGFLPDPARVRHPKDKPHVERQVRYIRERFFKGGRFQDLGDMRTQARRWCLEVAGKRVHGTTRKLPLVVFEAEERGALLPWDGVPYQVPEWALAIVHPDHHLAFRSALYSAPSSLCPPGSKLEVRGDPKLVRLYLRGTLVKVHPRQTKGGRCTDPQDYPAERTPYALRAPDRICQEAARLGPAVGAFAAQLLQGPLPWVKLRQGQKLLRLGERYTAARLDAACRRALQVELIEVRRVERILVEALEAEAAPEAEAAVPAPPGRFARPGEAFAQRSVS